MKDNPTAFDLLLAYAECVESFSKSSDDPKWMYELQRLGYDAGTWVPLSVFCKLRRRAIDAAKAERGDGHE